MPRPVSPSKFSLVCLFESVESLLFFRQVVVRKESTRRSGFHHLLWFSEDPGRDNVFPSRRDERMNVVGRDERMNVVGRDERRSVWVGRDERPSVWVGRDERPSV